ncbi:peptidase [Saccharomonospora sp. CUA-673]|uniref:DUF2268 domain-containing protein n=1 Tax=Saccharomonospora sp. CUA-673 TaxID=1904969 RepID=UPI00095B5046|nr:DUF2268 domain-containing putative Zn-dependent protease [Saccharomonospora sp. CUA-673]OLT40375.1 peptidase [Saccharomonospora sp. CUA-673]
MQIVVHDTVSQLEELLTRPIEQRPDALREILEPLTGMFATIGVPMRGDESMPFDAVAMHTAGGSGFPLDRDDDRLSAALELMRERDVLGGMRRALAEAWAHQLAATPDIAHPDELHVVTVLGNPDDDHLLERSGGYLGFGGIPGFVHLTVWPDTSTVDRLAYCAVHELNHNMRYANVVWNPETVTVGEQSVGEGLAEAFVGELYGPDAMGVWSTRLTGAAYEQAEVKLLADIDVAGQWNLTPYVHGDATAVRMGQEPVGLPDHAGYAVGRRIVERHCAASGRTVAESTALPLEEILVNAGVRG